MIRNKTPRWLRRQIFNGPPSGRYQWYVILVGGDKARCKNDIHVTRRPHSTQLAGPFNYRADARNFKKTYCQERGLRADYPDEPEYPSW